MDSKEERSQNDADASRIGVFCEYIGVCVLYSISHYCGQSSRLKLRCSGLVTVHSWPSMLEPRLSPPESPLQKARDLCQVTDLASDLKKVNQKARKPEKQLRAGAAFLGLRFSLLS